LDLFFMVGADIGGGFLECIDEGRVGFFGTLPSASLCVTRSEEIRAPSNRFVNERRAASPPDRTAIENAADGSLDRGRFRPSPGGRRRRSPANSFSNRVFSKGFLRSG